MHADVTGVEVIELTAVTDPRGDLAAAELSDVLPFAVARVFTVYNVPDTKVRGEHAHRRCHQFLVCVAGAVTLGVDDGRRRARYRLDRPTIGVHLAPMVWGTQFDYTADAVLVVFASHRYDADDYIRDYDEFLAAAASAGGSP
ncbi:MAG: sugar 3,4-ketoisomerase [Desertimonas sp.]